MAQLLDITHSNLKQRLQLRTAVILVTLIVIFFILGFYQFYYKEQVDRILSDSLEVQQTSYELDNMLKNIFYSDHLFFNKLKQNKNIINKYSNKLTEINDNFIKISDPYVVNIEHINDISRLLTQCLNGVILNEKDISNTFQNIKILKVYNTNLLERYGSLVKILKREKKNEHYILQIENQVLIIENIQLNIFKLFFYYHQSMDNIGGANKTLTRMLGQLPKLTLKNISLASRDISNIDITKELKKAEKDLESYKLQLKKIVSQTNKLVSIKSALHQAKVLLHSLHQEVFNLKKSILYMNKSILIYFILFFSLVSILLITYYKGKINFLINILERKIKFKNNINLYLTGLFLHYSRQTGRQTGKGLGDTQEKLKTEYNNFHVVSTDIKNTMLSCERVYHKMEHHHNNSVIKSNEINHLFEKLLVEVEGSQESNNELSDNLQKTDLNVPDIKLKAKKINEFFEMIHDNIQEVSKFSEQAYLLAVNTAIKKNGEVHDFFLMNDFLIEIQQITQQLSVKCSELVQEKDKLGQYFSIEHDLSGDTSLNSNIAFSQDSYGLDKDKIKEIILLIKKAMKDFSLISNIRVDIKESFPDLIRLEVEKIAKMENILSDILNK